MNSFWVTFKEGTTVGKITAGLDKVNATDRSLDDDGDWLFKADWKTDQKSLNNLRGKIETGSGFGSVTDIGVQ